VALAALMVAGLCCGGCSYRIGQTATQRGPADVTGSIGSLTHAEDRPTDSDMVLARNAASDVLTRGGKDSSQPWENPKTGARGSVTPLASVYMAEGRTCRDFLASYVKGSSEAWLQGEACKMAEGGWEIRSMRPWKRS